MAAAREIPGDTADPAGMAAQIDAWCDWLRTRGYSPHTIDGYRSCVVLFADWAVARGIDRPRDVTQPIVERYQRSLTHHRQPNGRPLTTGTQLARLLALRQWFRWLTRTHRVLLNPAADIDLPRAVPWQPRSAMTVGEVEDVMIQVDLDTITGLRDRAILEFLYSTGVRASELAAISLHDLDVARGVVAINRGKGGRFRIVPIAERATAWCEKYLLGARHHLVVPPDDGALFINDRGKPFTPRRLSSLTRGYLDAAAINRPGACHLFRHTAATLMLDGGADIRHVQAFLGHANITSTQVYTHVAVARLKAVHDRTHPAAGHRPPRTPWPPPGAPTSPLDDEYVNYDDLDAELRDPGEPLDSLNEWDQRAGQLLAELDADAED